MLESILFFVVVCLSCSYLSQRMRSDPVLWVGLISMCFWISLIQALFCFESSSKEEVFFYLEVASRFSRDKECPDLLCLFITLCWLPWVGWFFYFLKIVLLKKWNNYT